MQSAQAIGLVGLGLVGKALAERLLRAGYAVLGYDIDDAARDAAQVLGVKLLAEPAAFGPACEVVLLSLPNSAIVDDVLWGSGGLGPACTEGKIVLDTTTTRPSETVTHHQRLAERGVRFVDVPLVGSSREIGEGKAVALVGDAEERADYRPVIEAFAERIYFLGGPGLGHRAKLAVNLVLGLNRLVLAEGLSLAEKAGMDAGQVLHILKNSAAYSRAMDTKGDKMVNRDFEPAARLAQHAKDVGLILELAEEVGARAPASELHARVLAEAIDAGLGALDNSAVIEVFRE